MAAGFDFLSVRDKYWWEKIIHSRRIQKFILPLEADKGKNKHFLYTTMLIEGTLNSYLADVDKAIYRAEKYTSKTNFVV